ncbi:sugar phosphate permease [Salsuginibacillus halophilus]|uniref:Sugar phosphate permease n=1 Tax=Salsuginibacillus halophilus TaxID=517424 RepID=A0A2P8HCM7_9BACI|nr:MFS transporter [Salsuginibacillus halophilus]PSL43994.1 sugar phosphate permease [Salsuginibacillus halophilus]
MAQNRSEADKLPVNPPFFYGWIIVAVAALTVFFSGPGQTYSISVFIDAYVDDLGWSRTTISSLYSVATLGAGFTLFLIGRLVDKKGQRMMTAVIGTLLALACFWNAILIGPVMMFIGFFMLRLFGQGSMTLIPNTLIPQWFDQLRGRAISFMTLGGLVSAAALPPMNLFLINSFGWRSAWMFWGIMLLLLFVPAAWFFIRNRPQNVGLLPDDAGAGKEGKELADAENHAQAQFDASFTLQDALHTKAFWFILFCAAVPSLVNTGITFHLFSIMAEREIPRTATAFLLSLMPIAAFTFTLVSGFIVERVAPRKLFAAAFLLKSLLLVWLVFADALWAVGLYVILWGVFEGTTKICNNIIWPNYFGLAHLGRLRSLATTAIVIGSALGPLPFGYAFDVFNSYNEILLLMILLTATAMILAYAAKPPLKQEQ